MQVLPLVISLWIISTACVRAQANEPAAIVVRPPANSTVSAGQTVQLMCVAYGYPTPNVTWSTMPSNLDLNDKVMQQIVSINTTKFVVSVLQLCDVTPAQTSEYSCTADNGLAGPGIASQTAKFFLAISQPVTEPPAIVIHPPENTIVDANNTVEMVCVAYGNPIPTITWTRPGCTDLSDTSETANIKIASKMVTYGNITFRQSVLQICRVFPEDGVQYTCEAKNGIPGLGIAISSASFSLSVIQENSSGTGTAPTSPAAASNSFQLNLTMIIAIAEGGCILLLLTVATVVTTWACVTTRNAKAFQESRSKSQYKTKDEHAAIDNEDTFGTKSANGVEEFMLQCKTKDEHAAIDNEDTNGNKSANDVKDDDSDLYI